MSNQNTVIQAGNGIKVNCELNSTPNLKKEGRELAYLHDSFLSVVLAVNPITESLSIHLDTKPTNTKSFLSRSGYVIDDNSTAVLRPVENDEIWIQQKSKQLLSLLRSEDVESGVSSLSEAYIKQMLKENRVLTLQMINRVYLDNIGNTHIQIGILHLSSHIDYSTGYPTLQTVALAAISDRDDDVKDYAIQCYENWNHKDGLRVLRNIHSDTEWLQIYIDSVIVSLSENFMEVTSKQ